MPRPSKLASAPRRRRGTVLLLAGVAGFALAALAAVAVAATHTLNVAKNAAVTNTMGQTVHENIAVDSRSRAVYTLSGDSKSHPECTKANHCFSFWPPVKVRSTKGLSKASGIKGRLGTWRRDGFIQLTLAGHPLYRYVGDGSQKRAATGEGIRTFGGVWHVVKASISTTTTTTGTTTMGSTTTAPTTMSCTPSPGYPC